jgi:hypothetical protein
VQRILCKNVIVKWTPKRPTMVILRSSSSPFPSRFGHEISDAKSHALDPKHGVERDHSRANRQLDHHHDRTVMKRIRQELLEGSWSIFPLEQVIRRPAVINPDVIARIDEITMTNRRMSSVAISQAIIDAPERPRISPTTFRRIRYPNDLRRQ